MRSAGDARHPALDFRRMPEFMRALEAIDTPAARCLRVIALTASRSGAVRLMRFDQIDFGACVWRCPAEQMKELRHRSEAFEVPLSDAALVAIGRPGSSPFVFAYDAASPINDMALIVLTRSLRRVHDDWRDPKTREPFVVHGLRATFRGWAEIHRKDREIAELVLGHRFYGQVERAYARGDLLDERRLMLDAWGGATATAKVARSFRSGAGDGAEIQGRLPSSGQKPRRTSSERIAWLAKMRLAVARKEMFDPAEADIAEMRAVIGDNKAFAKFSGANETLLFCVMLTLKRKLEVYGERVRSEQERTGAGRSVLAKLSKVHGLLSAAADEMNEVGGTIAAGAAGDKRGRRRAAGKYSKDCGRAKGLRRAHPGKPTKAGRSCDDRPLPQSFQGRYPWSEGGRLARTRGLHRSLLERQNARARNFTQAASARPQAKENSWVALGTIHRQFRLHVLSPPKQNGCERLSRSLRAPRESQPC